MTVAGTWDVRIRTPVGTIAVVYVLAEVEGVLTGTATSSQESVPLTDVTCDVVADGEHLTWRQAITRPMRLHLVFDVVVRGDELAGHSRAGRLPRSTVTGTRRPEAPGDG